MRMEMLSMNVLMALKMMAMLLRVMTVRFVEGPGENWEEQGVEEEERGGAAQCSWPRRRSPRRPRRCCRRGCPWSCGENLGQGQLCASFKLEWRQVVKIFSSCRHQWELNKKSQFPRNPLFVESNSKFHFRKCVEWIVRQQIRCILCHRWSRYNPYNRYSRYSVVTPEISLFLNQQYMFDQNIYWFQQSVSQLCQVSQVSQSLNYCR